MRSSVGQGQSVTKEEFRRRLRRARESHHVSDSEVDLLFGVFDKVKDGLLTLDEFSSGEAARYDRDQLSSERHSAEPQSDKL